MTFAQGDMRTLPLSDASLAGIVAFYSLIHLERGAAGGVLTELTRVLIPGGLLLLAFHGGEARSTPTTGSAGASRSTPLSINRPKWRAPYEFEYQTTRVYAAGVKR